MWKVGGQKVNYSHLKQKHCSECAPDSMLHRVISSCMHKITPHLLDRLIPNKSLHAGSSCFCFIMRPLWISLTVVVNVARHSLSLYIGHCVLPLKSLSSMNSFYDLSAYFLYSLYRINRNALVPFHLATLQYNVPVSPQLCVTLVLVSTSWLM